MTIHHKETHKDIDTLMDENAFATRPLSNWENEGGFHQA